MAGNDNVLPYRWQKGQSGNPGGQIKVPDDIKTALKNNRWALVLEFQKLFSMTHEEVMRVGQDKAGNSLTYFCARMLYNAAEKSDVAKASFIAEHSMVPLPKLVEIMGQDGGAIRESMELVITDYRNKSET